MFDLLFSSMLNIWGAFGAGVLTFFASCLLPLVPSYIALLTGISAQDPSTCPETKPKTHKDTKEKIQSWKVSVKNYFSCKQHSLVMQAGTFFVLGFTVTFVSIGLLLQRFAVLLVQIRPIIEKFAGVLFIALGVYVLGIMGSKVFGSERSLNVQRWFGKSLKFNAFLAGLGFAFGWSPCIGPALALILYWVATTDHFWQGFALLVSFSLGIGTPFLVVALAYDQILPVIRRHSYVLSWIRNASGIVLVAAGAALVIGKFQVWGGILTQFLPLTNLL